MLTKGQYDLFRQSIVAQSDDENYQESGYVVVQIDNWVAIARYGHCSCYDTWADLTGGGISDDEGPNDPCWNWQGTPEEFDILAKMVADPIMPERPASPDDYDYDHLVAVYAQWLNARS